MPMQKPLLFNKTIRVCSSNLIMDRVEEEVAVFIITIKTILEVVISRAITTIKVPEEAANIKEAEEVDTSKVATFRSLTAINLVITTITAAVMEEVKTSRLLSARTLKWDPANMALNAHLLMATRT